MFVIEQLQETRQNQQQEHQGKFFNGLSGWLHDFSQVGHLRNNLRNEATSKKRHRGDLDSCGQSPVDLQSTSLTTRTRCRERSRCGNSSNFHRHVCVRPYSSFLGGSGFLNMLLVCLLYKFINRPCSSALLAEWLR